MCEHIEISRANGTFNKILINYYHHNDPQLKLREIEDTKKKV